MNKTTLFSKRNSAMLKSLALVAILGAGMFSPIALAIQDQRELFGDFWTGGVGGRGSAMIDGVMQWEEWRQAGTVDFLVNTPEGGPTPATLYIMNDRRNLYIGLKFIRRSLDPRSTLAIGLDADKSGVKDVGDDGFLFNPDAGVGFRDNFVTWCPDGQSICGVYDTSFGGSNDGAGAIANDGTYTTYELMHPLNSGDPYDITLLRRETVGVTVSLRLMDAQNVIADTKIGTNVYLAKIRIHLPNNP